MRLRLKTQNRGVPKTGGSQDWGVPRLGVPRLGGPKTGESQAWGVPRLECGGNQIGGYQTRLQEKLRRKMMDRIFASGKCPKLS